MKKILLVEDSQMDIFLTRLLLKKLDPTIEVLVAHDGEEALAVLQSEVEPPLLVLLDINMPGMDGHAFLEHYSATGRMVPVVVMLTSSDQEEDRAKAFEHAIVRDYLLKPLTVEKVRAVDRALNLALLSS